MLLLPKIIPNSTKFVSKGNEIIPKSTETVPKGTEIVPKGTEIVPKGTEIVPKFTVIVQKGTERFNYIFHNPESKVKNFPQDCHFSWPTKPNATPLSLSLSFRLFVLPQYDSALIEQSLLLNRRRNEKEHLKQQLEEHFEDMDIVDGLSSLANDKQLDLVPKIYLCGTLWHESKGEMIQILKSIMRMDIDQSARKKVVIYALRDDCWDMLNNKLA